MKKHRIDWKQYRRQLLLLFTDSTVVCGVSILALWLQFDLVSEAVSNSYIVMLQNQIAVILCVNIVACLLFGLYTSVWEFAGVDELLRVFMATLLANVAVVGYGFLTNAVLPKAFYVFNWVLCMMLIGGVRLSYRLLRRFSVGLSMRPERYERVMLIGAGKMGTIVLEELNNENFQLGKPVVFVDDDARKIGKRLKGIRVAGNCAEIPKIAKEYSIDSILFCIPSASELDRSRILKIALATDCKLKVALSVHESITNGIGRKTIRSVNLADLLARPEVTLDRNICKYLTGQVVLVTGGGGSIGSELCRQVACYHPRQIIIFEIYENNAFELQNELKAKYGDQLDVQLRIGSVRDMRRLEQVFEEFHPTVVFHAAAHKHVPILEDSPCEAVKNNVFGTLVTAKVAREFHVARFVLLSTDKAVNPTSVMGATKRVTEMVVQALNWYNKTIFAAVRFGNVLGSNGSVIPIFKKQIENGGPVTITHPDITRYFMTIPEAAQMVVQAGGLAKGGEVFVLDMGEPVKILDLAYNLIRLSGLEPDVDIKIKFTGLRPGEKLYEELAYEEEQDKRISTQNQKIMINPPIVFDTRVFRTQLDNLLDAADAGDVERMYGCINEIVYKNTDSEKCIHPHKQ